MPLSAKTNKPPFLTETFDPQGSFIPFRKNWLPRKEGSSLVFAKAKTPICFQLNKKY